MKRFGLIGRTLSHSFSPHYFRDKFNRLGLTDHTYELFEMEEIEKVLPLLAHEEIHGLNVTIPFKEAIIPLLHVISPTARSIGAVNTITFENGKVIGENTDVIGFERSLLKLIHNTKPPALVFGTGGASKTVQFVLHESNIPFQVVSRNHSPTTITYRSVDQGMIHDHPLLINTTPIGMYPKTDELLPIPYKGVSDKHIAFDLIYNPSPSSFLQACAANGAQIKDGLEMLHLQADAAWEIWNTPNMGQC